MIRRAVVVLGLVACGGSAAIAPALEIPPDTETPDDPAPRDAGTRKDAAVDAGPPPFACGEALPGPALKDNLTEGAPGFAEALAAVDLATIPDPLDYTAASAVLTRPFMNWMLDRAEGTSVTHEEALRHPMGRAVLASAANGKFDLLFLRRALYFYNACTAPVPRDLDAFVATYGDYTTWPTFTIDCSKPKNGPRRIRENEAAGVFIAETLEGDHVRETEVVFDKLRPDGQLDFAVYLPDGRLTDRSTFAAGNGNAVVSAAPYTCMTCHRDTTTGAFTRLFPTGTGAGCK